MTLIVSGTILASQYPWLLRHARMDDKKELRCRTSNRPIETRVLHFARLRCDNPDEPHVAEHLLTGSHGGGTQLSLTAFWCTTCNERPGVPDMIHEHDTMYRPAA